MDDGERYEIQAFKPAAEGAEAKKTKHNSQMVYNPAVPVSEMKLKIKKFQNWLAGNHHKDIEKRLRHDKDGAK